MQILILALVALASVAGSMAFDVFKQNTANSHIQSRTVAGNLLTQATAVLASESSDIDGDGFPEAPGAAAAANTPTGGGVIPLSSGAPKTDSWGTGMGLCSYNHGSLNSAGAGRLAGNGTASQADIVFAVISAGPDKSFQTSCAQAVLGNRQGDDGLRTLTVSQLRQGVGGTQYFGDPVATEADLALLNPAALKDGELRVVKASNELKRWNAAGNAWAAVAGGGGGGGTSYPAPPGYSTTPPPFLLGAQPNLLAANQNNTFAVTATNELYAAGQLINTGDSGLPAQTLLWTRLSSPGNQVTGVLHTPFYGSLSGSSVRVIQKSDGSWWAIGRNELNQYGLGHSTNLNTWTQIMPAGFNPAKVELNPRTTYYLTQDNKLYAAGWLDTAATATAYSASGAYQLLRSDVATFASSSSSLSTNCLAVVTTGGQLWTRGNAPGCGIATATASSWTLVMEQVSGVFFVRYSTAWQMWVLKADGSIVRKFSSGGSLVNGGAFEARAESGFSQVNVWANVDCPVAFKEDGSAWMMNGPSGATTTETLGAFKRLSLPDVVAVYPTYGASGPNYGSCSTAFAVKTDGTVWVVGDNSFGKVGNGTTSNVASWTQVL